MILIFNDILFTKVHVQYSYSLHNLTEIIWSINIFLSNTLAAALTLPQFGVSESCWSQTCTASAFNTDCSQLHEEDMIWNVKGLYLYVELKSFTLCFANSVLFIIN